MKHLYVFMSWPGDMDMRWIFIPSFFFRKEGYINFVPKSVRRPSVRFLVNVSPKPLEVATSNFVAE